MAEYIAELIGFAAVLFVLGKWVAPALNKGMRERQEAIRVQLEEAEEAKKRLASAQEKYENALDEARHEAKRMNEDAQKQSAAILVEMREQARADARRIVEQARQQIEADHQQARNELQAVIGRLTAELAGHVVHESLQDDTRQGRVVDRFLEEIEERARVGA